jgi:hypothetical protein
MAHTIVMLLCAGVIGTLAGLRIIDQQTTILLMIGALIVSAVVWFGEKE